MYAFTCPHCGAGVNYDLSHGAVSCEYCDSLITLEDYEAYLEKKGQYQTTELCCPQCGGVVLSYDNTISTFCSYCGSSVIFDRRVREEQKPDGIIPFAFKEKAAVNRYRERTDRIILAPDWIREEGRKELTGIYMPFYQYEASCSSPISVKAEKRRNIGSRTEVSVYHVDGTLHGVYDGNRFDAAVAFPDALSESIDTYAWKKAEPFRPGYVAGFYADGSDVAPDTYDPIMAKLVSDDINTTNNLSHDGLDIPLEGATSAGQIRLSKKKILMPVWLLTHRVNDRICYAAVNGQNGDVAADIPLGRGKFIKVSLIVAAVLATFLNIFLTIKPMPFLWISMSLTAAFGIVLGKLTHQVYVREHHFDDIGRIGYRLFAKALKDADAAAAEIEGKQSEGAGRNAKAKRSGSAGGCLVQVLIWSVLFFIGLPLLLNMIDELFPGIFDATPILIILVVILIIAVQMISGLVRTAVVGEDRSTPYTATKWKYSKSRAAAFSVLWKVWLALAAGAVVILSGTVADTWYYAAGLANILVSVWAAFDVIRKQNLLASRDIPIFSMKRGGAE